MLAIFHEVGWLGHDAHNNLLILCFSCVAVTTDELTNRRLPKRSMQHPADTVQPRSHGPRDPDKHQTLNGKFGICLQTTTRLAKLPLADGEGLCTRRGVVQPFDLSKMPN
jgi:hypothetical protein